MKTFDDVAAQGDLIITRINSIPEDAKEALAVNNEHVVAHSETGHNHVVAAQDAQLFRPANDDMIMYLAVHNETELRHLRSFDTHEPITIKPGNYQIRRQREYTPRGWRRVED